MRARCLAAPARALAVVLFLAAGMSLSHAEPEPAPGPVPGPATAPATRHEVLPNGLEVSVVEDARLELASVQVWYHVGAANETKDTRGFAHLFEHLMFGGTATHDKRDYAEYVRRHGGRENAYTSWDETVYHVVLPPHAVAGLLALEADRMVHLRLDDQNLANEKRIVTEELRLATENSPIVRAGVVVLKAVLGDHPYAVSPAGTKEDIAAATLEHARAFYASYYRPRNAHVVVVGPRPAAETLEAVRAAFGALPGDGVTPPDVPSLADWPAPPLVRVKEDLPPVEAAIVGYPLPPPQHPDYWTLQVLDALLGGGALDPFRERLVAQRGKALEAGARAFFLRRGGALVFYSGALPYRREKTAFALIDETVGELGRLDWLTDEAVAAARRRLQRQELEKAYDPHGVAAAIGSARWTLGDVGLGGADARAVRIAAVTRADVERAWRTYVTAGRATRIYAQPERVPLLVRLFGWLWPLFAR